MNSKAAYQDFTDISADRREVLRPLVQYCQEKLDEKKAIQLNFICTHNSRRSHLAQIWAQCAAHHYEIPQVVSYSGGTEATAMFPMIGKTLGKQGMELHSISGTPNPVYLVKHDPAAMPIVCFSKVYDHPVNPKSNFAAVMTCSHADENCPLVLGAESRIAVTYRDPKEFDNTDIQEAKYKERSVQIATEMFYVFSQLVVE